MILLAMLESFTKLQSSKTQMSYEVTENFPQDYSSQRSVFDLHFWFRTVINKADNTSENQDKHNEASINDKILTESFEILHYFVELRHKYLNTLVNEKLHNSVWSKHLAKDSGSIIDQAKIVDIGNQISKTVLETIENEEDTTTNCQYFPTLKKLYQDFISTIQSDASVY